MRRSGQLQLRFSRRWSGIVLAWRGATFRKLHQHLFFAVNQSGSVVTRQFEAVSVSDCVRGAGLDAVPAEDAAIVVDVVNSCVALSATESPLFCVFRRFDIDAVRRASRCAQEAGHTLLETILIPLQHVR